MPRFRGIETEKTVKRPSHRAGMIRGGFIVGLDARRGAIAGRAGEDEEASNEDEASSPQVDGVGARWSLGRQRRREAKQEKREKDFTYEVQISQRSTHLPRWRALRLRRPGLQSRRRLLSS